MSENLMGPSNGFSSDSVFSTVQDTCTSLANGATAVMAHITIPKTGLWIVHTKGWNWANNTGSTISQGWIALKAEATISNMGLVSNTFTLVGIINITTPNTEITLELTNWEGVTLTKLNKSSANFTFNAYRIG